MDRQLDLAAKVLAKVNPHQLRHVLPNSKYATKAFRACGILRVDACLIWAVRGLLAIANRIACRKIVINSMHTMDEGIDWSRIDVQFIVISPLLSKNERERIRRVVPSHIPVAVTVLTGSAGRFGMNNFLLAARLFNEEADHPDFAKHVIKLDPLMESKLVFAEFGSVKCDPSIHGNIARTAWCSGLPIPPCQSVMKEAFIADSPDWKWEDLIGWLRQSGAKFVGWFGPNLYLEYKLRNTDSDAIELDVFVRCHAERWPSCRWLPPYPCHLFVDGIVEPEWIKEAASVWNASDHPYMSASEEPCAIVRCGPRISRYRGVSYDHEHPVDGRYHQLTVHRFHPI